MPLFGKKANLPVACLPLLAALTPSGHDVTLIDENVENIDFDSLAECDIVGVTGLSVQRFRMREIFQQLRQRGVFTVVGGPWITVSEHDFDGLVDVIFVGEAEETWPQFLREWKDGKHSIRYQQAQASDLTALPVPRFDLLKARNYMFGNVQFSRGCPFQCEFCEIPVIFGRGQRLKTSAQIIAELDALVAAKFRSSFVVDDNMIGNKKGIKLLLHDIITWQQTRHYPLTLFGVTSLDLAEDEELMRLMVEANFVSVFIGLESPNEESLQETMKFQNLSKSRSMLDKIHSIQHSGLDVWGAIIIGFDHDDVSIFDSQVAFLRDAGIAHVMISLLLAVPKTPLYERLRREGRLDEKEPPDFGTNVIPAGMTRAELRDGYLRILKELYEPDAYFGRLDTLFLNEHFKFDSSRLRDWQPPFFTRIKARFMRRIFFMVMFRMLMGGVPHAHLREEYRRRLRRIRKQRHDSAAWFVYAVKCAMHYHHYTMIKQMINGERPIVSSL